MNPGLVSDALQYGESFGGLSILGTGFVVGVKNKFPQKKKQFIAPKIANFVGPLLPQSWPKTIMIRWDSNGATANVHWIYIMPRSLIASMIPHQNGFQEKYLSLVFEVEV